MKRSIRYDRVAGYFRSSSLAIASQGFSAFVGSGGRMRLIAGADLDTPDVAAILEGNQKRLEDRLNQDLGDPADWPEDVTRGVELLAWMVAKGILEVRVAFRVHGKTTQPLAMTSTIDGYVHEKWALFSDSKGHRIYIAGSLNESRTALIHNAENIEVHADWWEGTERQRVDAAETEFEHLWQGHNPHIRIMTLPEAVKQRLIQIGEQVRFPLEIDGSTAARMDAPPLSALERLRFAVIKDGPKLPGGRYVGMVTAPIEPWPHQEVVARRLIETWPYSYLLCDEVGLGKTIEAGLAFRSLYLSGIVKRILIAPPASLTEQWQREMANKFFLPFARGLSGGSVRHARIFPTETTDEGRNLFGPNLCIVSTGLLSRSDRRPQLMSAGRFDIALVDEAHAARRKNPKNGTRSQPRFGNLYRSVANHLRDRSTALWLATATPMQIDWIEVFDLLTLTRRVGPFLFDPSLTWAYYQAVATLVNGSNLNAAQWDLLRRSINTLRWHDPLLWTYLQDSVIDGRIASSARRWLDRGTVPVGVDRRNMLRLIFSAAPLPRFMLRHGRQLLEIYRERGRLGAKLARRTILPIPRIVLEGIERRVYDDLEAYCHELTAMIADHHPESGWRTSLGFYLSFLRLRCASSIFALRETLQRRLEKVQATLSHQVGDQAPADTDEGLDLELDEHEVPDDRYLDTLLKNRGEEDLVWEQQRLAQMLDEMEDLSATPLKMQALLQKLDERRQVSGRIRQTVIFTRFYDTLKDIIDRLRLIDSAMLVGTYSGKGGQFTDPITRQLKGTDREEIKHRFLRGEIDVLVCTDAAAEGLNLQTADLLINYDLPWNPMKVEQRIGRIDRIGQKYDRIEVLNLCYADSAEQIVYGRLLQRLVQAGLVVGSQQISMLPVTQDEFSELAAGELAEETLLERAKDRIAEQKRRTACMEIPANDLYEIYLRLKADFSKKQIPVTLNNIWDAIVKSDYLSDMGCTLEGGEGDDRIILRGLKTVIDGTLLTVNRNLYEQGLADVPGKIHFATYGDMVFEALLNEINLDDLPPCVVRLSEKVPDIDIDVVAYAVACITEVGQPVVRLITSCRDLEGIALDETTSLSETDLNRLQRQFHDLVRQEFDPTHSTERHERANLKAGLAQEALNTTTGKSMMVPPAFDEAGLFWPAVNQFDALIESRNRLLVPAMPADILGKIKDDLLFDIQVPNVGDETSQTLPILLIATALDQACRLADNMRVPRAELTIDRVKRSLSREGEKCLQNYMIQ